MDQIKTLAPVLEAFKEMRQKHKLLFSQTCSGFLSSFHPVWGNCSGCLMRLINSLRNLWAWEKIRRYDDESFFPIKRFDSWCCLAKKQLYFVRFNPNTTTQVPLQVLLVSEILLSSLLYATYSSCFSKIEVLLSVCWSSLVNCFLARSHQNLHFWFAGVIDWSVFLCCFFACIYLSRAFTTDHIHFLSQCRATHQRDSWFFQIRIVAKENLWSSSSGLPHEIDPIVCSWMLNRANFLKEQNILSTFFRVVFQSHCHTKMLCRAFSVFLKPQVGSRNNLKHIMRGKKLPLASYIYFRTRTYS